MSGWTIAGIVLGVAIGVGFLWIALIAWREVAGRWDR